MELRYVRLWPAPWLLAAVFGCGDDPRTEARQYRNQGGLCLAPRAGGGAQAHPVLNDCESACAQLEAACEVSFEAGAIDVAAEGSATWKLDGDTQCPDLCQPVAATCELPPLPEGTYELRYGERSTTVRLPLAGPTSALDGPNGNACSGVVPLP